MKRILFFFALFFLIFQNRSFASENFSTDYSVIYNIQSNATAHVVFDITLTNATSQYYASSYSIQVGFKNIQNIRASDEDGQITPIVVKNENGQKIDISFNKKIVGLDNKLNFQLSFDTSEVVQKNGKIWQIDIPGLSNQENFKTFNVSIKAPSFLKNPVYVKPRINNLYANNLTFNKEQLGQSGISVAFGEEQIYEFNLLYHLKNRNLFPVKTEIAIPPNTNYQEIFIEDIEPKPLDVIIDADRNWLAQYILTPSQRIDVTVKGKAKVLLTPKEEYTPPEKLKKYLEQREYWETSSLEIKKLAETIKTPKAIYEYLVKNLEYDFTRVTDNKKRLGALNTLKNPSSAVCLEFTDLFIALARAAGIPAREVNGYAYTQNSKERPLSLVKDILHAWPEFYDDKLKTWIMVDPTWGNTTGGVDYFDTLDFDHFTFVIKGIDSMYPVSAGGYKLPEEKETKDVLVKFDEDFEQQTPILAISENFSPSYFSNMPIEGKIIIKNIGKHEISGQFLTLETNFLKPTYQKIQLAKIPPFGAQTIAVAFKKTSFLTNSKDAIKITSNNESIVKNVRIYPFLLDSRFIIGGILIVSSTIILSIITFKAWRIFVFRQKQ